MILGAGLLMACAAGAAFAGPYFPAGIVLAALLVWSLRRADESSGDNAVQRHLRAGSHLALGAAFAGTAAEYLLPEAKALVAVGLVVVAGLVALRVDVSDTARWVVTAVLAVAAVGFVAVCFGLTPVEPASSGLAGEPVTVGGVVAGLPGVLLSTVLFVALLAHVRRGWGIAVGVALAVAVSAGALYQLGPVRLGLANTSLRDALAAADAGTLMTLFNTVVVLATLPALLAVLASARRKLAASGTPIVVAGYALAAVATLLGPPDTLLLASAAAVSAMLIGLLRNRRCRASVSSDTVPP